MTLHTTYLGSPNPNNRSGVTTLDFLDWREQSKTLEEFHIFTTRNTVVAGKTKEAGRSEKRARQIHSMAPRDPLLEHTIDIGSLQ